MIIRKITLKNFQAHKNLTLELDNFTAIVGPSSAGKSAILRALSWMFYGDWDKTYPNDPEQETAIAIQLEDGTLWGRFRKGARNWAMCRKPGEKPMVYQDFGEIVPGLLEELNVRPIKLNNTKVNLNFSMQDDPIFMVHESKPAKAQWIGRLYGAHIINQMLRLMAKDKRAIESAKTAADEEETRLKAELVKYEGLEEQAESLERADELIRHLQELCECQEQMATIMRDREAIKRGSHFLTADTDGMRISLARLQDLIAAQDASLSVQRDEFSLNQKRHLLDADLDSIKADLDRLTKAAAALDEYRKLAQEIEANSKEHARVSGRLGDIAPILDGLRSDMRSSLFAEGRCPLCQSKPRKLDMDQVAANLKELVRSA